jgi:uncharacterized protein YndB with AHSA1/START domain
VVAAPADAVWRAIREPAEILRWFGWEYESLAEEVAHIFVKGAKVVEEGRRLSFAEAGDIFVVEPRGARTVVRLVRSAPAGTDWDGVYDEIVEGWRTFLQQLRFTLEAHAGDVRRTLFLSGRSSESGPRPPAAIGLTTLVDIGAGEPYTLQSAPGDALTGRVWFRSAHQVGVTVDGFGNGLLIVHDRPPTPASPHGGGMAVLTTYGLDDEAFEALRARWTRWWESTFDSSTVQTAPHKGA